jgi:tRNA(His) guanylyltransferase
MSDDLGNRMKFYEGLNTPDRLMPLCPVIVRLDGCCFHNFTKGLNRP